VISVSCVRRHHYSKSNSNRLKRVGYMIWFVQYKQMGADHLVRVGTPEQAIETACRLLDDGCDVYGIGTGPLTDSIGKEQIARIYDMWVRAAE